MIWLRQSTARTVVIGPFVDSTDGATAETGLTIAQADIRLSKNGGAFAQTNNSAGATHMENGYYSVPLDTTDTGTLGVLRVAVNESGALPVWADFMCVPANVWDSMFGSDRLEVDAHEIEGGDATNAIRDALVDDATRIDASALNTLSGHDPGETIMGATDLGTGSGLTALASAADLATVDTVVDGIASDVAALNDLDAGDVQTAAAAALTAYDPPTHAELTSGLAGLSDLDAAGVRGAVGLAAANLDTQLAALPTDADVETAAGAALATYDPPTKAELDAGLAALNDPAAGAIADAVWDETVADHSGVGSTGAALAAAGGSGDPWSTALPGAYGAGSAGSILGNLNDVSSGDVQTAAAAALTSYDPPTKAELDAAVSPLATSTEVAKDATVAKEATVAALNDLDAAGVRSAVGLAAANLDTQLAGLPTDADVETACEAGLADYGAAKTTDIPSDYATAAAVTALNDLSAAEAQAAAAAALTAYDPPTRTEATSDKNEVLAAMPEGSDAPTAGEVADAVWDEALVDHAVAGSTGARLAAAAAAGDPWTAELPGDYDVGTAGALLPALAAALSALGAGSVVVTSPVAESGTVTLHAGDDYDPADGRGLLFTVADETHALHLDEAGCVVRFKSPQVTWSAASVSTTPAGYLVMFSLTHEQTSALSITRQLYELEATQADGDIITLATGTLVVVRDIPAVG